MTRRSFSYPTETAHRTGRLNATQGTALYVGAVLGTGVIALPALAAEAAGPASLLAWLLLVVVSAPLAATFAALGARHPDAGGVSTYARLAFGHRAAALLVWSFVGWETITHLTGEFRDPARDVPRATTAAILIIGALYLAVAFSTIAVLGPRAAASDAPLGELMAVGLGGDARILAAVAALLLTFGAMNAYYAGAAKLGAALGRDGALPAWLSRGSQAGEVPRRSLAVNAGMSFVALAVVVAAGVGAEPLVLLTTGSFVTVYAVGAAAALRLLPRGGIGWATAVAALIAVLALLAMIGKYLLWPVVVTAAALLYLRHRARPARSQR